MAASRSFSLESVAQAQKVEHIGVTEDQIRREAVFLAQRLEFLTGQRAGLSRDGRAFVEQALNLGGQRARAPALQAAQLGIKFSLERLFEVDELSEVGPTQLSTQRVDNLRVGKDLRKTNHVEQVDPAKTRAEFNGQGSTERVDDLFAVLGALFFQEIGADPVADLPVEPP